MGFEFSILAIDLKVNVFFCFNIGFGIFCFVDNCSGNKRLSLVALRPGSRPGNRCRISIEESPGSIGQSAR